MNPYQGGGASLFIDPHCSLQLFVDEVMFSLEAPPVRMGMLQLSSAGELC